MADNAAASEQLDDIEALRTARNRHPADNNIKFELACAIRRNRRAPMPKVTIVDAPFSVTNVELTNHCPMRCGMCPRTHDMTRELGFMSDEVFERVVRELAHTNPENAPAGILYLHHFGESLLHRRLDAFGALANELGLFTSISVNPVLLRGPMIERLLGAQIGLIQFALDGYDAATFAAARGMEKAFDDSVSRLRDYLGRHRAVGSRSRIVVNIIDVPGFDRQRLDAQEERWRREPGVDAVYRKPFVNWNGSSAGVNRLAARRHADATREGPVVCTEPFESLSVAWDGSVLACCFDYEGFIVLGNIMEQSLSSLWNGPRMRELRAEFLANQVTNRLCRSCSYLRSPIGDSSVLSR